jgi:hypothetical protein
MTIKRKLFIPDLPNPVKKDFRKLLEISNGMAGFFR